MLISTIHAISPVDGRYRNQVKELSLHFSEGALHKYRILVEIEYLVALCEEVLDDKFALTDEQKVKLRGIYEDFTDDDALWIKDREKITNHDVKAVEYFIKHKLDEMQIADHKEWVHFGLTSQDVNNTAIPLSIKDGLNNIIIPALENIISVIKQKSADWKNITMLARTHGQPASPTRMGKEMMVFVERLEVQLNQLKQIPYSAKFGGATGNFNAHHVAFPEINWVKFANGFVNHTLGLNRSQYTTQIEHYDNIAAVCDAMKRINNILLDFSRDIWMYVMMDYFKQKIKEGEVGSSAMPHKVNPIDFENAEGNLGIANALFEHFAAKLPVSRLQRDLTDSTVLRNIGVPFAHTLISFKSILKGIDKLMLNEQKINDDLEQNWAVVAEGIQTVLRKIGYPEPYEALKGLTRKNTRLTSADFVSFIDELDVNDQVKAELKKITPANYTGL